MQLIDFGRSIDMTLFPQDTVFTHTVKTTDFVCHEMREKLPWTYQVTIFRFIFYLCDIFISNYFITDGLLWVSWNYLHYPHV